VASNILLFFYKKKRKQNKNNNKILQVTSACCGAVMRNEYKDHFSFSIAPLFKGRLLIMQYSLLCFYKGQTFFEIAIYHFMCFVLLTLKS
jgi:hypothetical protein